MASACCLPIAFVLVMTACDGSGAAPTRVTATSAAPASSDEIRRTADRLLFGEHSFAEKDAVRGKHCRVEPLGQCMESATSKASCEKQGGSLADGPCPTDGALGICRYPREGAALVTYEKNRLNRTAVDARSACETTQLPNGKWDAGEAAPRSIERINPAVENVAERCLYEDGTCRDYGVARGRCEAAAKEACPIEKRVGSCVWADGMTERFYRPKWSVEKARAKCLDVPPGGPGRESFDPAWFPDEKTAPGNR